ncbi:MAG: FHA domain-containing protein [Christensenellales bacterium]|jgi:hypothetical protein
MAVYEATALAMRYWFLIAAIIVLLGVTGISVKEYREKRFVLGVAQSSIGYLTIISGPEDILNEKIQLMHQNTIGRSKSVDIVLRDSSIYKAHSQIYRAESGAVYVNRLGRGGVSVNGTGIGNIMQVFDQDIICFGNIVTKLHLKEVE